MGEAVRVRDRATGRVFDERVFSERELRFLYEDPRGRALTDRLLSRPWASALYGLAQRTRRSRASIPAFVERLGIDAGEAALPLEDYASLDHFFTRRLRPGARPVDPTPGVLVSPADGRALVLPCVAADGVVEVKGSRLTLTALLGDVDLARRYAGGAVVVVRLAPADYHRVHFPAAGVASAPRRLGRRLHSVHPIALAQGAPSLANAREVTRLDTPDLGALLVLEVGALLVGTIVQTFAPGPVRRGQEKALFRFGGSTVVVLAEPGRLVLDDDLVAASAEGLETLVRMGTRLGARREPAA